MFPVEVTALDTFGNTATGFSGNVNAVRFAESPR